MAFSGYRIGQSGERIRIVRLYADDDALVQQDSDPHAKADHDCHPDGMDLPVGAIDAHQFCAACNDLCRAPNGGAVLGADVRNDLRIAADALHFIGVAGSQEFDLALVKR